MYKGYVEITPTHEEWAELYESPNDNIYNTLNNEYLILHNENGTVDNFKWANGVYKKLSLLILL